MASLAMHGGSPVRTAPFPAWPVFDEREIEAVTEVLRSGKWWYGERVAEFEAAFAGFQGAAYGVTCVNGTAALEIGLLGLGVGLGDEVIVPAYSFIATALVPLLVGATPVFADISPQTCNLDPAEVEAKLTERTRAIIPVHFGGLPADMDALGELARRRGLVILEDACHSWGSQWRGKGTGALGDCGAFSFQMSKNLTCGEGGILLSDREEVAEAARGYSNLGRARGEGFYRHFVPGRNLRLTEIQAALLLVQLTRLEEQTLRRQANAAHLDSRLADHPGLALIPADPRVTRRGYHMYIFRFLPERWEGLSRGRFLQAVQAEGIPAGGGYPTPLYRNPVFAGAGQVPEYEQIARPYPGQQRDYSAVCCPHTEQICREACWIMHPVLLGEERDMDDIAEALFKVWEQRGELMD